MIGDGYCVRWRTNYHLSSSPPSASRTDRLIAGMLPESKLLPPGTYGFNSPYVSRFTGMMIDPPPPASHPGAPSPRLLRGARLLHPDRPPRLPPHPLGGR